MTGGGIRPGHRPTTVWIPLFLLLLLNACSLKEVAWDRADWLAQRQINTTFDLNDDQEDMIWPVVRQQVARLKKEEAPRLLRLLEKVRDTAAKPVSEKAVRDLEKEMLTWRQALAKPLIPAAARLLLSLTPEQKEHFRAGLREFHAGREELLTLSLEDLEDAMEDRREAAVESLTEWLGSVTPLQLRLVGAQHPADLGKLKKQLQTVYTTHDLFFTRLDKIRTAPAVEAFLLDWSRSPGTEAYRQMRREINEQRIRRILALDKTLSGDQRQFLVKKIDSYVKDLRDLMKRGV